MLGKLAVRNTKRSIKDYLIYLITITISFSLILAFNLIASSDKVVELSTGMGSFKTVLTFINAVIVFVVCFLINYTTRFMFEKRSKELGTYMLLGIKKKKVAHLLVTENILLGFLAFVLSIPLGFLLLVLNAIRYFEGNAMIVMLSSNPSSRITIASFATS